MLHPCCTIHLVTYTHNNQPDCDYCGSTDPNRNIDQIDITWGPFHLGTAWLCDDDECVDNYDGCRQPTAHEYRAAWTGHHA